MKRERDDEAENLRELVVLGWQSLPVSVCALSLRLSSSESQSLGRTVETTADCYTSLLSESAAAAK